jgi:TPR repeat protein
MKVKFLDKCIPQNYTLLTNQQTQLSIHKEYKGRTYTLLGCSEKALKGSQKIWLAIRTFALTLFSLGFMLFFKDIRDDWAALWKGKKTVVLYGSSLLSQQVLADRGDVSAQYNLGFMHHLGIDVPQSYKKAAYYYRLAAKQNDALAQCNLGILHVLGNGVPQSTAMALDYFHAAAKQGDLIAQDHLEMIYGLQ